MILRSTFVFATFLAALLQGGGCTAQPAARIAGNITPHPDWKPVVYLVQPRRFNEIAANFSGTVLDSAKIGADGRFVFPNIDLTDGPALLQLVVQIIGYSIDSSPEAWRAAIAKDGAVWTHASHLSGDATPFMETLRITTVPANFILDKNGNVVAKNLHGAALKTFVENY